MKKHITFYWISFAFLRCANSNFYLDFEHLPLIYIVLKKANENQKCLISIGLHPRKITWLLCVGEDLRKALVGKQEGQ